MGHLVCGAAVALVADAGDHGPGARCGGRGGTLHRCVSLDEHEPEAALIEDAADVPVSGAA
ncbi:MAG: hypothetical protein OXG55_16575 [bacterium]|nr:hypothetical protein [bacterium]